MKQLATLCSIVVLTFLPLSQAGTPAQAAPGPQIGPPVGSFASVQRPAGDIASLRTRTSRTYFQDGHYAAQIADQSINYQDGQGQWQPINDTLTPAQNPQYAEQNTANRYTVDFPADLGTQPIHLQLGSGWLEFQLVGLHATGSASGNTETYGFNGGSMAFGATGDAVKESITLTGPSSPSSFSYTISASPGLQFKPNPSGGIDVIDPQSHAQFSLAAPFMTDAAGVASTAVSFHLAGSTLTETADPTWLQDPARQWPVVIDPTVTVASSQSGALGTLQDCYLNSGHPTLTYCSDTVDRVGYVAGNGIDRQLLRFSLAGIPQNAQVLNADLAMFTVVSGSTTAKSIDLYGVTQPWTTSATWTTYDGTHAWSTAGGDYTTPAAAQNPAVDASPAHWSHWYPTQLVQGWVNGSTANNGLELRYPTESATAIYFAGSRYSTANDHPTLTVYYEPWIGDQSFYTLDSQTLTDQMDMGVNVANGNLEIHQSDLSMPSSTLPLTLDRSYNSMATNQGVFGSRWIMSTASDVGLVLFGDGSAALYGPSGFQVTFQRNSDGSYTAPPAIDSTLVQNSDGTFTLTEHGSGESYVFSSGGFLLSHKDADGNAITFGYTTVNNTSLLAQITDTQGRITSFSYACPGSSSTTLICQMTDSAGRTYQYRYDSSGNLTSYTDPAGEQVLFGYDSGNHLTGITDPNGNLTTMAYDSQGRVSSVTRAADGSGQHPINTYTYSAGQTVVTDPNQNPTTYSYDLQGRVTETQDAQGHASYTAWTPDAHVSQVQAPTGGVTDIAYNSTTNVVTSATGPTGIASTASYGDSAHPYQPTAVTANTQAPSSQQLTTTMQYNTDGSLAQATGSNDPSHPATIQYNSNGTVSSMTDALGRQSTITYNSSALPTSATPPIVPNGTSPSNLGGVSTTYNAYNLVDHVTDGNGNVTQYLYDLLGRVTGIAYADGMSVGYSYDRNGNVLGTTRKLTSTAPTETVENTYNVCNELTNETESNGHADSYGYDLTGNVTALIAAAGTTQYHYNSVNQVDQVTDPYGNTTGLQYNGNGDLIKWAYANGLTRTESYNAADQPTGITVTSDQSGQTTTLMQNTYSYVDPNNTPQAQPHTSTNSLGNTNTSTYSTWGSILTSTTTDKNGVVIDSATYTYDQAGLRTSMTENGVTTTYTHNDAGQLATINGTPVTYNGSGDPVSAFPTNYAYNTAGQVTSYSNPTQGTVGLTTCVPDPNANFGENCTLNNQSLAYTGMGLESQTQNGQTDTFTNLPSGEVLSETTPSGTSYPQTDAYGNVVGEVNSATGAMTNQCTYDPNGNATCSNVTVPNPYGPGGAQCTQTVDTGPQICQDGNGGLFDTSMPDDWIPTDSAALSPNMHPIGPGGSAAIRGFYNPGLLDDHFNRHGKGENGMRFGDATQYEESAINFFESPSSTSVSFVRTKGPSYRIGDVYRFDRANGHFGILSSKGYIRTYFVPAGDAEQQMEYFSSQYEQTVGGVFIFPAMPCDEYPGEDVPSSCAP